MQCYPQWRDYRMVQVNLTSSETLQHMPSTLLSPFKRRNLIQSRYCCNTCRTASRHNASIQHSLQIRSKIDARVDCTVITQLGLHGSVCGYPSHHFIFKDGRTSELRLEHVGRRQCYRVSETVLIHSNTRTPFTTNAIQYGNGMCLAVSWPLVIILTWLVWPFDCNVGLLL
jgi:hypothetical protein